VTIVNNRADYDDNNVGLGGGLRVSVGSVYLYNTIIAQNIDPSPVHEADCSGPLAASTYNLVQNATGCLFPLTASNNVTGTAPLIGPLKDNGGPTWTHALLSGSPAIDAGRPYASGIVVNNCLATDQRGVTRPIGSRCDIGAYEAAQPVYLPLVVR
jgi:hypothetical protein